MKIINFAKLGLIVLLAIFAFGCARSVEKHHAKWTPAQLSKQKLADFDIPIVVNDRVATWIDYFQGAGRGHFARYLQRSGRYVPEMQEILKKYGLPQDLVYLALIESGFSSRAYSRAKASGHWQFISGTGKLYGLDITPWVDERRDSEKSTIAAARFLKDLYGQFGDWYLAMAAYNAGPRKIENAISITGSRDFWQIIQHRYLKAETKDYVPKFIAAAIMAKSPEKFGFGDVVYDEPIEIEDVKIPSQTDLQVIAKCADIPVDVVADLNSELVRGATPPNASAYKIKLPKGTAAKFEVAFADIPESERILIVRHTVKRGESAGAIAKRFGISVRELLTANDIKKSKNVKNGMVLVIPKDGSFAKGASATDIADASTDKNGRRNIVKHKVKGRETLAVIAGNYNVTVSELKKWNKMKGSAVRKGQVIKIYSGEAVALNSHKKGTKAKGDTSYVVRRGDSWWKVAQRYGVSINELKGWNEDLAGKDLKAGKKLKLFTSSQAIAKKDAGSGSIMSKADATDENQSIDTNISSSDRLSQPTEVPAARSSDLLAIQDTDVPKSDLAPIKSSSKMVKYRVKRGDTLDRIAKHHGVSVSEVMAWNNMNKSSSKNLKAGTVIKLQASSK